jgi:hypothetical protein
MCKALHEFLGPDPKVAVRFAKKIGVDPFTLRRYRLGLQKPQKDAVWRKIAIETNGQVVPNDFIPRIPERVFEARYGRRRRFQSAAE